MRCQASDGQQGATPLHLKKEVRETLMFAANRLSPFLFALLASMTPGCGEGIGINGEPSVAALRLEPFQLESIDRWDSVPHDQPLLRDDISGCTENSCWFLHNDSPRDLKVLHGNSSEARGVGIIERRAIDGTWYGIAARWFCECGTGAAFASGMIPVPSGTVRQLGESDCQYQHPPLAAGEYRFLIPLIAEVDGIVQVGFVARRFLVTPQSQPERNRMIDLLADPRVPECAAQNALLASLVHGSDATSLQSLISSQRVPAALHTALLDALVPYFDQAEWLAGPLRQIGSPLGRQAAIRLSHDFRSCQNDTCDAILAQLVAALVEDPPDVAVVNALRRWTERWPFAVLERLVDLIGQDIDETLQSSVESALFKVLMRNDQQRASTRALLAKRCQTGCKRESSRAAVESLLEQEAGESDGALASIYGGERALIPTLAVPSQACANLHSELRQYMRFLDGLPLGVELGDTQTAICDRDSALETHTGGQFWGGGCAHVRALWQTHLYERQLDALLAAPDDSSDETLGKR
jgi:hypothetical protein